MWASHKELSQPKESNCKHEKETANLISQDLCKTQELSRFVPPGSWDGHTLSWKCGQLPDPSLYPTVPLLTYRTELESAKQHGLEDIIHWVTVLQLRQLKKLRIWCWVLLSLQPCSHFRMTVKKKHHAILERALQFQTIQEDRSKPKKQGVKVPEI